MKKFNLSLLFVFVQCLVFAQNEQTVSSKVENVKVFLNNAVVTHSSVANLTKGTSTLVIKDFPSNIDQNSIQVIGKGAFTLLSVAFETDFQNQKVVDLELEIKVLEASIENLKLDQSILDKEEKMLMANASIGNETDGVLPEDLAEMQTYFRNNLNRIGKENLTKTREIVKLEKQKTELQNQLNVSKSNNQPLGKMILNVKAENAGRADLEVSYLSFNCGWSPNYDIRVKDTESPANVVYKAKVFQNTGIDWKNVNLTLSTSNPNQGSIKPEIYTQYLSFYVPQPRTMNYARAKMEEAPMADALAGRVAGVEVEMESASQFVAMEETSLDLNFKIDIPYSINSGKKAEEVEIVNTSLPAEYNYYVVPKFDTDAFLIATLKDWEKYSFLPGAMNVYFEDAFVGKSFMPNLKAEDKLAISLGRDARIVAERKELTDFKSKKTFGSNIRETFSYRLEIKNNRSSAIKIFVEDQYPISQNSEIEVDLKSGDASIDKEKGKLTWELNIPSKGIASKEFGYEVKYPKDKVINNL